MRVRALLFPARFRGSVVGRTSRIKMPLCSLSPPHKSPISRDSYPHGIMLFAGTQASCLVRGVWVEVIRGAPGIGKSFGVLGS